jgi:hypothetical protein
MSDPREEALAAITARFAREEADWRYNNPGKVRFYLLNAPDEAPRFTAEGQSAVSETHLRSSAQRHRC